MADESTEGGRAGGRPIPRVATSMSSICSWAWSQALDMFSHGMYDLHDFARVCPSRHPCLIPCWLMIRTGWSHAWLRFESKVRSPQLVSPTASVPRLEQRQQTQLLAARASGP